MCGRFVSSSNPEQIAAYFDAAPPQTELTPSYNVAPTTDIYAVVEGADGSRRVEVFHWGLIPVWAKDIKIGQKMINARAETVATAPSFRAAFKKRRCLIPATGFYEWKKHDDGSKEPYLIGMRDGVPFAFASLWERWDKGEAPIETCTIITGEPNSLLAELHNGMPVILEPED